jgi:hypothetical protein
VVVNIFFRFFSLFLRERGEGREEVLCPPLEDIIIIPQWVEVVNTFLKVFWNFSLSRERREGRAEIFLSPQEQLYYITLAVACQHFFKSFLEFFSVAGAVAPQSSIILPQRGGEIYWQNAQRF